MYMQHSSGWTRRQYGFFSFCIGNDSLDDKDALTLEETGSERESSVDSGRVRWDAVFGE